MTYGNNDVQLVIFSIPGFGTYTGYPSSLAIWGVLCMSLGRLQGLAASLPTFTFATIAWDAYNSVGNGATPPELYAFWAFALAISFILMLALKVRLSFLNPATFVWLAARSLEHFLPGVFHEPADEALFSAAVILAVLLASSRRTRR